MLSFGMHNKNVRNLTAANKELIKGKSIKHPIHTRGPQQINHDKNGGKKKTPKLIALLLGIGIEEAHISTVTK